ncbi:LysR substrate-binding domain-containing protein [Sphingomonas sp. CLY1604]|uniref:LysR substrate-binding domain-containing protein n=1 Tax=Sphingomonas sp. CLY1604 TaxID=3457786 RepID=UPI003FD8372B
MYDLPPLSTLTTFEAAARHLSFKNAAVELNVTPGAVSHQIKALESELGTTLFRRRHRGVELTADGGKLFSTLAESFYRISAQLREVRAKRGEKRVKIGTTSAVANLWTSHMLSTFWREHPDITVDQLVSEEGFGAEAALDMYIRYGKDHRSDWSQQPIYRDELVPVGDPALAIALSGASIEVLSEQRLIHLEQNDYSWTTWNDWFTAQGHPEVGDRGFRVNNYMIGLHAAMDGMGLMLGWRRLVGPLLEGGRLKVVEGHSIPAPRRFYLVSRPDEDLAAPARLLKGWIGGITD